jgi:hypothetical protein
MLKRKGFGTWEQKTASKFGNIPKTIDWKGKKTSFQSTKEANRAIELLLLEKAGKISELERQVTYRLEFNGVLICKYIADFTYTDERGNERIEYVKGVLTDVFKLKRRMMKALDKEVEIV